MVGVSLMVLVHVCPSISTTDSSTLPVSTILMTTTPGTVILKCVSIVLFVLCE